MTDTSNQTKTFTILAPLDGSAAAESTLSLTRALLGEDGRLVLLSVVPPGEPLRGLLGQTVLSAIESGELACQRAAAYLSDTAVKAGIPDGTYEVIAKQGDPSEEILQIARDRDVDLVAMATSGRGAAGRIIFGSVADRISRHGVCPVLLLRGAGHRAEPERLVVPLDGSEPSESAVPVAVKFAQRMNLPIRLVRIVETDDIVAELSKNEPRNLFELPPDQDYKAAIEEVSARERERLEDVAKRLVPAGIPIDIVIESGSASFELLSLVGPTDLVVLTSHGRSGFRRWLLGSVAEKLVRNATAPVVIVRPATSA